MMMENILLQALAERLEQQFTRLRYATAKDQNGRIENGKVIRYGDTQIIAGPLESRDRQCIALEGGICYLCRRQRSLRRERGWLSDFDLLTNVACDRGSRGE